jgi:hypothetical protein
LIEGTLLVLGTWIVLYLMFAGIGLAVSRSLRLEQGQCVTGMPDSFWLGWLSTLAFLQVWHLWAPVSGAAMGIVGGSGIGGLLWCRAAAARHLRELAGQGRWSGLLLTAFSLLLANMAMGPIGPYDAGLYHAQTIRWIGSYPAVPGLGNLHLRLAFNSSHFLYLALLNTWPWTGYCHHVGNGLLIWVLCLQLGGCTRRFVLHRGKTDPCDSFHVLMVPGVLWQSTLHASSTSPDLPLFILGVLAGGYLCRLVFHAGDGSRAFMPLFMIAAIWFTGTTIRLNLVVLGALCFLTGAFVAFKKGAFGIKGGGRPLKDFLRLSAPAAVVLVWMIRGAILSGYPSYPVTALSFDVPWRVPESIALGELQWIRSWARNPELPPELVLGRADWLGPWFIRILTYHKIDVIFPLLLTLLGLCIFSCETGKGSGIPRRSVLFLSPPLLSLAAWFMQAPSPRFAGACFWYLGAGALSVGVDGIARNIVRKSLVSGVCAIASAAAIAASLGMHELPQRSFHPVPVAACDLFTTSSGLSLHVPAEGDQCWNASLPCTPYPNKDLRLLRDGNLGGGFSLSLPSPDREKPGPRNDG